MTQNLSDNLFLPGSLGSYKATNWIFSNETHWLSLTRQNPPCSTICLIKEITFWFPYLSTWGKLISSQNTTTHFPLIRGANWMPLFVFYIHSIDPMPLATTPVKFLWKS